MDKYLKLGIPILLIIVILLILYCLGFIKLNLGEFFSSEGKSICKPLVIKNTPYNSETEKNKDIGKYYLSSGDNDKFYCLIENIQPFNNQEDSDFDIDELAEVKQSLNYIWCLNTARNQIMMARYNKQENFNNLQYKSMIKKPNISCANYQSDECEEAAKEKLRYITAFGVSQSTNENDEFCVIGVTDFGNIENSFLVIFKPSCNDISIYQDSIEDSSPLEINIKEKPVYKKIGKPLFGNIIINKSQKQNTSSDIVNFDIICLNFEDQTTQNNFINVGELSIMNLEIKGNLFSKIEIPEQSKKIPDISISENKVINSKDKLLSIEKVKVFLASNPKEEGNNRIRLDTIKNLDIYIDIDNYKALLPEIKNFTITDEDNDIANVNKINMYYKLMNRFINYICSKTIKVGFVEINYINNEYHIIYCKYNDNKFYIQHKNYPTTSEYNDLENIVFSTNVDINQITGVEPYIEFSNSFYEKIAEKKNEIVIKDSTKLEDINNNLKYIHEKTEMINDDKLKGEVQNLMNVSYILDNNNLYFNQNIVGILDYEKIDEREYPQELIRNKILHKRNVLFILHQHITHDDNIDGAGEEKELIYGRFMMKINSPHKYNLVPSIKFTYGKSFLSKSKSKNISLKSFFESKQSLENGNNSSEFKNFYDWIDIFSFLKNSGQYFPNKYDNVESNKNSMIIGLKNALPEKFQKKHQDILNSEDFDIVFDVEALGKYPNFEVYTIKDESVENDDDKEVMLSPRIVDMKDYRTEDIVNEEGQIKNRNKIYLGLDEFNTSDGEDIINTNTFDGKTYYYYNLITDVKEKVDNYEDNIKDNLLKQKYIWQKRIINNFKEFKDLILNNDDSDDFSKMETLDRDRLRGLLELDDKYVDDYYLLFLEQYKKDIINKLPLYKKEDYDLLLDSKNKLLNNIGTYNEKAEVGEKNMRTNQLGYPFHVIFKYIDLRGKPCNPDVRRKQKLFLINILDKEHLEEKNYKNILKEGNGQFQSKRYPFIKQEFMSFTGYGNLIQFNISKVGGVTDIDSKKLCGGSNTTFTMGCDSGPSGKENSNSEGCSPKKLGFINLDGTPRCEIVAPDVKKASETSVETLLIGSVDVNACSLYLNKGDHKIYFKLGRVFIEADEKIQIPKTYTIQDENNQFLYVDKGNIKKSDDVNEDSDKIANYYFIGKLKQDNYGTYMTFNPLSDKNKFLTAEIDVFTNKLTPLKLEAEIKEKDRNSIIGANSYINDTQYYSQKFIVPESLIRNMAANDGTDNPQIENYMREQEVVSRVIGSFGLDGITTGSTDYTTGLSPEQEAKIIEKQLGHLKLYLNNLNTIFQEEKFDIEGLKESLKVIREQIVERIPFIEKRLQNIKYMVSVSDNLRKRDMRLVTKNTVDESKNRLQRLKEEKNKKNTLDNSKEENMNQDFENTKSALEALKGFFMKENKEKEKNRNNLRNEINDLKKMSNRCQPNILEKIETFDGQYNVAGKNIKYKDHVVDKYQTYLKNTMEKSKDELDNKTKLFKKYLEQLESVTKSVKHDSKQKELLVSQMIDNDSKINRDVIDIKSSENASKIEELDNKIVELKKLQCRLGKNEKPTKETTNYRSVISRYDGELLTSYELQQKDKSQEEKNLDVNMLLINGGCLAYDQKNDKLNVEHCMIGNKNQHFNIKNVKSVSDLKKHNLDPSKGFDKSFSLISQPNKNKPEAPVPSCAEIVGDYCLHKEDGEVSMRPCDNIKNHQWIYSNVSGSCN